MHLVNIRVHISIECVCEFVVLKGHRECFNLIGRSHEKLFIDFCSEFVNELLKLFAVVIFRGWGNTNQYSLKCHSINDF